MNCPVCKRELAPTLSICLTCGAMMNDTVREELETKIARPAVTKIPKAEIPKFEPIKPWTPSPVKLNPPAPPIAISSPEPRTAMGPENIPLPVTPPESKPPKPKLVTAELKKETSPTLVDFQPTNPTVPDWRLQLQNSVRKRNLDPRADQIVTSAAEVAVESGSAAIAARSVQPSAAVPVVQNEKLANAIRRIEASKRTFGSGAAVGMAAAAHARARKPAAPERSFPFDVVPRNSSKETPSSPVMPAADLPKPKLVSPMKVEKKKFDTNKLPPIPEPESPLPDVEAAVCESSEATTEVGTKISFDRLRIWNAPATEATHDEQESQDEIDDLAPFSMRFGSAVFDLIIGSFAAGILLSPLLLSSSLGSTAGLLAIFGGWMFVMFAYFTGSIVFLGRTFGMKLFSIEMIDAEANELPTVHQAAVHSAVYLLSLMLFGLGFVPAFFNEERRAMHDLVAGTLLIREY